jgi:hypothetical protein
MRGLIFAVAVILSPACVLAEAPIQFRAVPPDPLVEVLRGEHAWKIYASGIIDENADQRLEEVLRRNNIPDGSYLFLHSPGGNMSGGMKLGKTIRNHLLLTNIGQFTPKGSDRDLPGECYSACAMAFLGGEYRFLTEGSIYGVHRFFWEKSTGHDLELAQMMSAVVVEYIRSMDVNTDLFTVASRAGRDEVMTPSRSELIRLNVINNGAKKAKWTIESIPQGIYLKGERETWNGINKFMIMCPARRGLALYIIFDPGQNAEDVMQFEAETLFIDYAKFSLAGRRLKKEMKNGWINLMYSVDANLIAAIGKATTVGIGLQPTTEASFFAGFDDLPFDEGRAKLPGLLRTCNGAPKAR